MNMIQPAHKTSSRLRILICTQSVDKNDPILGFFHSWIEEFAVHAERIIVVCLRKGEQALPGNVEVIALGETHRIFRAIELVSIVWGRRRDYDAVFVHMNPEYVVAAGWLWRLSRKRVALWYVHKSTTFFLRIAFAFVHNVFTVSEDTFPLKNAKVKIVGHGIDPVLFAPSEKRATGFRVVTVGRVSEKKNTKRIAEAVLAFAKNHTDVSLDIYGAPVTENEKIYACEVAEWVTREGRGVVQLHGSLPNEKVPVVLQGADVFINLGETGGVDKAVLEAMACGVPVISSSSAHAPLLLQFPQLIVEANEASILCALEAVYSTPHAERKRMGEELRRIVVEHHSLKPLVKRILWTLSGNR